MTTLVTLIGDVTDAIGTDFDPRRTKAYVRHNTPKIVTDEGPIHLGGGTVNVAADGTFTLPNVVASTSLVENLQATVYVDYEDRTTRQRATAPFGPYDLSGETGTVDVRALEEVQALDPSFASETMATMRELLAEMQEISGLTGEDEAVAYLLENDTDTRGATDARYVKPIGSDLDPGEPVAPLVYFNPMDFGAKGTYDVDSFDDTAFLQAAIDAAWNNGGGIVYVPQGPKFRVEQLELKEGVVLEGSMAGIAGVSRAVTGSQLIQAEGSSVDMIIGTGFTDPGGGHYLLPCGLRNLTMYGNPTQSPSGKGAFASKDSSGTALNWQHGCLVDNVIITGFRGDGLWIPGGSGVQDVSHVFGYMNGGYVIRIGASTGNVQHVHLIDISGDGNKAGAVVRIDGQEAGYETLIEGLKSEQLINWMVDVDETPSGSVVSQPNALHLHNCESDVVVTGLQHIAGIVWSVVGGTADADTWTVTGGTKTKPGHAIVLSNSSSNSKRPTVMYQGKKIRVDASQVGGDTPAWIHDTTNSRDVKVPNDHAAGMFGGHASGTMMRREQTPGSYHAVVGYEGTPAKPAATTHVLTITGTNQPAVHLHAASASSEKWKGAVLKNAGDGRVMLRIHDGDGNTLYDAITFKTDGTTGFATEWGINGSVATYKVLTQTYSTADATLGAYTPDVENTAYTGTPADAASTAKLADLNALRVAYENLRQHHEDLAQFVNSLVDALQGHGIVR